jgi:hypothetical protein
MYGGSSACARTARPSVAARSMLPGVGTPFGRARRGQARQTSGKHTKKGVHLYPCSHHCPVRPPHEAAASNLTARRLGAWPNLFAPSPCCGPRAPLTAGRLSGWIWPAARREPTLGEAQAQAPAACPVPAGHPQPANAGVPCAAVAPAADAAAAHGPSPGPGAGAPAASSSAAVAGGARGARRQPSPARSPRKGQAYEDARASAAVLRATALHSVLHAITADLGASRANGISGDGGSGSPVSRGPPPVRQPAPAGGAGSSSQARSPRSFPLPQPAAGAPSPPGSPSRRGRAPRRQPGSPGSPAARRARLAAAAAAYAETLYPAALVHRVGGIGVGGPLPSANPSAPASSGPSLTAALGAAYAAAEAEAAAARLRRVGRQLGGHPAGSGHPSSGTSPRLAGRSQFKATVVAAPPSPLHPPPPIRTAPAKRGGGSGGGNNRGCHDLSPRAGGVAPKPSGLTPRGFASRAGMLRSPGTTPRAVSPALRSFHLPGTAFGPNDSPRSGASSPGPHGHTRFAAVAEAAAVPAEAAASAAAHARSAKPPAGRVMQTVWRISSAARRSLGNFTSSGNGLNGGGVVVTIMEPATTAGGQLSTGHTKGLSKVKGAGSLGDLEAAAPPFEDSCTPKSSGAAGTAPHGALFGGKRGTAHAGCCRRPRCTAVVVFFIGSLLIATGLGAGLAFGLGPGRRSGGGGRAEGLNGLAGAEKFSVRATIAPPRGARPGWGCSNLLQTKTVRGPGRFLCAGSCGDWNTLPWAGRAVTPPGPAAGMKEQPVPEPTQLHTRPFACHTTQT